MILKHLFKQFGKNNLIYKMELEKSDSDSDDANFVESAKDLAVDKLRQGLSDLRTGVESHMSLDEMKKDITPVVEHIDNAVQKTRKRFESRGFSRLANLLKENTVQVNSLINDRDHSRNWRENNDLFAKAINRENFSKEGVQDHVRYVQELLNLTQDAGLKEDGKLGNSTMAELLRYQAKKQNGELNDYDFSKIA